MRINRWTQGVALLVGWIMLAGAATAAEGVKGIVERMPGRDPAEEARLAAQLVGGGASAVREVCALLVPLGQGDDTKARFAVSALVRHAGRPGAGAERKMVAEALGEALAAGKDAEVRAFLIQHLALAGGDESVPRLAKLLDDEKLGDPAAAALTTIGTPAAEAALREALATVDKARLVPVVKALGTLRSKAAAKQIAQHASGGDDAALHWTALYALANAGAAEGRELLARAAASDRAMVRSRGTSLYLLYARRLAEAGQRAAAEEIARGFLRSEELSARSAALATLVDVKGDEALADLLAAAGSAATEVRAAALELAGRIEGQPATARWVELARKAELPEARADVVRMLARRGDAAAVGGVREALRADGDEQVRLAAAAALAKLAGEGAIGDLIAVARSEKASDAEVRAAAGALGMMPGGKAMPAVGEALAGAPARARVALIEVLAAREARGQFEAVFAQATAEDGGVRNAALTALGKLAGADHLPRLVRLAVEAKDGRATEGALNALAAAAGRVEDADRRSAAAVAALAEATGPKRQALLRVLPRLGGAGALATVVADLSHAEAGTRDAALRALSAWPDAAALEPLLKVAREEKDLSRHAMAVRGAVRIVAASKLPVAEKVKRYQELLEVSRRADEKRAVLSALAGERDARALAVAAKLIDDAELKAEAAVATIRIALPARRGDAGLRGPEVVEALRKAIPACPDATLKGEAEAHLKKIGG